MNRRAEYVEVNKEQEDRKQFEETPIIKDTEE